MKNISKTKNKLYGYYNSDKIIINKEDESHYHIYFNDDYKTEIKSYNLTAKENYVKNVVKIQNLYRKHTRRKKGQPAH